MTKVTVKMSDLIRRKEELDVEINEINSKIRKFNIVSETNENSVDLSVLEGLKKQKQEDLIIIKIKINEMNLKKLKGEKKSNAMYIYELSELNRELKHLQKIDTRDGIIKKIKGVITKFITKMKEADVTQKVNELKERVREVSRKLEEFNTSMEVSLSVNVAF
jgi:hypothetical protein